MTRRVWVTGPVVEAELTPLREFAEVELRHEVARPTVEEMVAKVSGLSAVIPVLGAPVTAEVIRAGHGSLEVVANFAVGYDNVEVPAATAAGIPVTNTPDVLVNATADVAFGLLIAAGRRFGEGVPAALEGRWQWAQALMWGQEVTGATLGILGLGRIGAAMARRA